MKSRSEVQRRRTRKIIAKWAPHSIRGSSKDLDIMQKEFAWASLIGHVGRIIMPGFLELVQYQQRIWVCCSRRGNYYHQQRVNSVINEPVFIALLSFLIQLSTPVSESGRDLYSVLETLSSARNRRNSWNGRKFITHFQDNPQPKIQSELLNDNRAE